MEEKLMLYQKYKKERAAKWLAIIAAMAAVLLLAATVRAQVIEEKENEIANEYATSAGIDLLFDKIDERAEEKAMQIIEQNSTVAKQEEAKTQDAYNNYTTETPDTFTYCEIPEEYKKAGGELPKELQRHIYDLCMEKDIQPALIIAMIERESGYIETAVGDSGESIGYMQIQEKHHKERMERLQITDLYDGRQNITVGIDIISELIDRYGTIQDALTVYNMGETSAKENMWSKGKYIYEYNQTIIERMKQIRKELEETNANDQ